MQRLLDVMLVSFAILVFSPLFLPIMILLRITGEGYIFFLQKRIGRNKSVFGLIKFVTMLKDSPNIGSGTVTLKGDPRILPLGHFLRKTKINELPQLLNVLNGTMSIIGPRPQTKRCFDAFPKGSQDKISKVVPGLSGIGSIVFRAEDEMMHANNNPDKFYDRTIMPYKGKLEEWYVDNKSLYLYFKCIILTLWIIVRPNSSIIWKAIPNLPSPPNELRGYLNWPVDEK